MSDRYKGAILSPTAPTVTPQSAGGIYTSSQQLQYQGQGVWPQAVNNPLTNSLRFRSSASAYLNRTPASTTNQRTFTWSGWVKRGTLGGSNAQYIFSARSANSDSGWFSFYFNLTDTLNVGGWSVDYRATTQLFRDPSAWYHLVLSVDTTQATASNRVRVYVNGSEVTAFSTTNNPTQNFDYPVNSNSAAHSHGSVIGYSSTFNFDGYLAEVNFVDGTQLTPSSFGTTDAYGIWQPIPYTGAYGTNGFYLPFTDNSALTTSSNVGLGKDFSGNGNYWTTNNISITAGVTYDSMKDVPTNTNSNTANYFVLNPLIAGTSSVLSNGNLTFTNSAGTGNQCLASMLVTSGSYYFEATLTTAGGGGTSQYVLVGDGNTSYSTNGQIYSGGVLQTTVATLTSGDVVGLAFTPSGSVTYYKNGASVYTGGVGGGIPLVNGFSGTVWNVNFGQQPFAYTPPSGFYPLNTYNLPTPTILAGNQYMDATTFTGNASTNVITNSGSMQPDMVWLKSRSNANSHTLYDAIRGVNTLLYPNLTNAEAVGTNQLTSFNSNGFTLGASENANDDSGESSVGWQWRASNAAGVSNTQGTITSTVSANTTAGFSIVAYTGNGTGGATVGHGLGVAPSMVIVKKRSGVADWPVQHISLGPNASLRLNGTDATANEPWWNSTAPSSTVFTLGSSNTINQSSETFVAYCFSAVAGYSAFGSYVGNDSADGTFIYTGFRPAFILYKKATGIDGWVIFDTKRNTYNVVDTALQPNTSGAEASSAAGSLDILSNGFKQRNANNIANSSSFTYIYACFAESPFKISRAR